jgi:hypothetical protein
VAWRLFDTLRYSADLFVFNDALLGKETDEGGDDELHFLDFRPKSPDLTSLVLIFEDILSEALSEELEVALDISDVKTISDIAKKQRTTPTHGSLLAPR